ncbi:dormancy-associated protein homolog 3-like [Magnolia sinica]|uniref:dormancy-associated protein homolog 3-like n=1 Tax=Magnolia sinica TaxID=86752 RepID=UPI002658B17A|nr:dormancy-associated protein homolog 3-like [Magnolia sinica]
MAIAYLRTSTRDGFFSFPDFLLLSKQDTPKAMGILDQLWDDTFAGPLPETGLSKLRKSSTFSYRGKESDGGSERSDGGDSSDDVTEVSRSIMIVKAAGNPSLGNGSPPSSPAGSTPPVSPFLGMEPYSKVRYSRKNFSSTTHVDV